MFGIVGSEKRLENSAWIRSGIKSSQKIRLGYGWGIYDFSRGISVSVADGSGGTFYARMVVLPEFGVAFAGLANCGNADAAFDYMLKKIKK